MTATNAKQKAIKYLQKNAKHIKNVYGHFGEGITVAIAVDKKVLDKIIKDSILPDKPNA